MNTTEQNKLIAEFMGAIKHPFATTDEDLEFLEDRFQKVNSNKLKNLGRGSNETSYLRVVDGFPESKFEVRDSRYSLITIGGGKLGKRSISNPYYDGWKYHNDWNWLISVVEKIRSMGYPVHIMGGATHILNRGMKRWITEGKDIHLTSLECAYKAVVEFIIWYNKQENK